MFRRSYIPKVLYSEGPIFRRFYVPKNGKVLYSEGSMFRKTGRFYIPKVLCSEISDFVAGAVVDDMDEIERVWVGVGHKKVGICRDNCTWRLNYYK